MADDLKNTAKATFHHLRRAGHHASSDERRHAAREGEWGDVFKPQTGEVVSDGADVLLAGSSTPITTKRASSSVMPTSSVPTIPIAP